MSEFLPHIATVLVASIGGITAILTQRTASKAIKKEKLESKRAEAESTAYERASAFDVDTIDRQGRLIDELNEDNDILRAKVVDLRAQLEAHESGEVVMELNEEVRELRQTISHLEDQLAECEAHN